MSVGKCADHASSSANLANDALERIVRFDLPPVIARKGEVGQRLVRLGLDQLQTVVGFIEHALRAARCRRPGQGASALERHPFSRTTRGCEAEHQRLRALLEDQLKPESRASPPCSPSRAEISLASFASFSR